MTPNAEPEDKGRWSSRKMAGFWLVLILAILLCTPTGPVGLVDDFISDRYQIWYRTLFYDFVWDEFRSGPNAGTHWALFIPSPSANDPMVKMIGSIFRIEYNHGIRPDTGLHFHNLQFITGWDKWIMDFIEWRFYRWAF